MRSALLCTALLALPLVALGWQCPLDMGALLPVATYAGDLPCQLDGAGTGEPCLDLVGRVAVVTGASTGIGLRLADRLVEAGMTVVGTSRTPETYLNAANCSYTKFGDVCAPDGFELWQLDQTLQESVTQFVQRVQQAYGTVHLLVLNAGRNFYGDMVNSDLASMQLAMETNFWGPLRVLRAAAPLMPKDGYARVLVTASVQSFFANGGNLPYPASKAGLVKLQETWVKENNPAYSHIQYVTVHPGIVYTDIQRKGIAGCPELEDMLQVPSTPETLPGGLSAAEAGEAFYRIALLPQPAPRYIVANWNDGADLSWQQEGICRHWTSYEDLINASGASASSLVCPPQAVTN